MLINKKVGNALSLLGFYVLGDLMILEVTLQYMQALMKANWHNIENLKDNYSKENG